MKVFFKYGNWDMVYLKWWVYGTWENGIWEDGTLKEFGRGENKLTYNNNNIVTLMVT
jgi:hypothetical protein